MKSTNPIFNENVYEQSYALTERPMTVAGTMNKLLILSLIMLVSATAVYYQFSLGRYDFVNILTWAGVIIGLVLGIAIPFMKDKSPYLAPIYAFAEGAFISGISCFFEKMYSGIVTQAISVTFLVVFAMAVLYRVGLIKATEKFRAVIFTATLAIGLFYLISIILFFFKVNVPYFYSNSSLAIGVNVVIALVAALNLIIDFDNIDNGVRANLPSYFEWYCSFGLLVTIVWLYIEILRLLARTRSRN